MNCSLTMEKAKVLFVSQEIMPYLPETEISRISRNLPQGILERGKEIRTFMPRYGLVNERRNQLHEVIRLSGMNLIIDDTDHPLIIKVASIQSARMQIYFIDNDDFFQRKSLFADGEGNEYADNDVRAIFFARGVLETTRKLRWAPNIIHCHGWFTSFVALYTKKLMRDDPHYADSKIVISVYDNEFAGKWNKNIKSKVFVGGMKKADVSQLSELDYVSLMKMAIQHADGVVQGSPTINPEVLAYIRESGKPFLDYHAEDTLADACNAFYDSIL